MSEYQTDESILIFNSDSQLLNAEDTLADLGWPYRLIPTPKTVHKGCGLALAYEAAKHQVYLEALREAGYQPGAAYRRRGQEYITLALNRAGTP